MACAAAACFIACDDGSPVEREEVLLGSGIGRRVGCQLVRLLKEGLSRDEVALHLGQIPHPRLREQCARGRPCLMPGSEVLAEANRRTLLEHGHRKGLGNGRCFVRRVCGDELQ